LAITVATVDDAVGRAIMLGAFEQFRGTLEPPSAP
jgi:hypothetical protein